MSDTSTSTPSPVPGCSVSDTDSALNIGQQWAASTRELIADKTLPPERTRFFTALAKFAERTGCAAVTDHEIDLWGYGTVKVHFADNDGNKWITLMDLIEPTGLTWDQLHRMYINDVEDDYSDVEELSWLVSYTDPDDRDICHLEYVQPSFAMRALLAGPWGKEFAAAMFPTFRRAIVASGMADQIAAVTHINDDGTHERHHMTFGEFIAGNDGPLPTREQAREQAFRGPAGAL